MLFLGYQRRLIFCGSEHGAASLADSFLGLARHLRINQRTPSEIMLDYAGASGSRSNHLSSASGSHAKTLVERSPSALGVVASSAPFRVIPRIRFQVFSPESSSFIVKKVVISHLTHSLLCVASPIRTTNFEARPNFFSIASRIGLDLGSLGGYFKGLPLAPNTGSVSE
jgi:hypothetical protein